MRKKLSLLIALTVLIQSISISGMPTYAQNSVQEGIVEETVAETVSVPEEVTSEASDEIADEETVNEAETVPEEVISEASDESTDEDIVNETDENLSEENDDGDVNVNTDQEQQETETEENDENEEINDIESPEDDLEDLSDNDEADVEDVLNEEEAETDTVEEIKLLSQNVASFQTPQIQGFSLPSDDSIVVDDCYNIENGSVKFNSINTIWTTMYGVEKSSSIDHTTPGIDEDSGSVKVTMKNDGPTLVTSQSSMVGDFCLRLQANSFSNQLKNGWVYKMTAWVYGETVNPKSGTDAVYVGFPGGPDGANGIPTYHLGSYSGEKVEIANGEWKQIEFIFAARKDRTFFNIGIFNSSKNDSYYIDDIVITPLSKEENNAFYMDYEKMIKNEKGASSINPYSLFGFRNRDNIVVTRPFAELDVTRTKNVLSVGEETPLTIYHQKNGETGSTLAELDVSEFNDMNNLTVTSSEPNVAVYENGKIIAKAPGNTEFTISYTYFDETEVTVEEKLLVTVCPDGTSIYALDEEESDWGYVTGPVYPYEDARVAVGNIDTGIKPKTPVIISWRQYYAGRARNNDDKYKFPGNNTEYTGANLFNLMAMQTFRVHFGGNNATKDASITAFPWTRDLSVRGYTWNEAQFGSDDTLKGGLYNKTTNLKAGWNNIDLVIQYPTENEYTVTDTSSKVKGWMKISYYLNGYYQTSIEMPITDVNANFTLTPYGGPLVADLTVAAMNIENEIVNVKSEKGTESNMPVDSAILIETLNVLDEKTFEENAELSDNNGQKIAFEYEFIRAGGKNIIKLMPEYPLAHGTQYTLKLGENIMAKGYGGFAGKELGEDLSYNFTTEKNVLSYEITSVEDGKITLEVTNNTNSEVTGYAVVSLYDEALNVKNAKSLIELQGNESGEFIVDTEISDISAYDYEVYLWDKVDGDHIKSLASSTNSAEARNTITTQSDIQEITIDYYPEEEVAKVLGNIDAQRRDLPVIIRIFEVNETNTFDKLVRAEEVVSGANGAIDYSFKLPEKSEATRYKVYVSQPFADNNMYSEFMYASLDIINDALDKMDKASVQNMHDTFTKAETGKLSIRNILNLLDADFDTLENKSYLYNAINENKTYYGKGADNFRNIFRRALRINKILEGDTQTAVNDIKENHNDGYWKISENKESSTFKKFIEQMTLTQQANVLSKLLNYSKGFSDNESVFNAAVIAENILEGDYGTVYTILDKFSDVININYGANYNLLSPSSKAIVHEKFYNEIRNLNNIDDMEKKFEELSASEALNGGNGGSQGGGGAGTGGAVSNQGVAILPGITDTSNPAPDWYVDENAEVSENSVFKDLENAKWAQPYIMKLYNMGAVSGKAEGIFAPSDHMTREELCKVIVLAFGFEAKEDADIPQFTDVDTSKWYNEYIRICAQNGIINGIGDNKFGVGRTITREETATILVRAAEAAGIALDYSITIFPFTDHDEISEWAQDSVSVLRECLIIRGYDAASGRFVPKNNVTRAEAAKMIIGVIEFTY